MTRRDPYAGLDLLADVFDDTADAPQPLIRRNHAGGVQSLWANPADPRWHVDARLHGDGEIAWIDERGIRFREDIAAHAPTRSEPPTAVSGPGNGNGGEA